MENSLPINRPSRIDSLRVNQIQFEHIFADSAVAMGEKIASDLAKLKDDIAPACDKTFVMMKNKQVWFDRNNAALFPKFEAGVLRAFDTNHQPTANYSLQFEGATFVPMTFGEAKKSFHIGTGNPYLKSDNTFKYFPDDGYNNTILTEELSSGKSHYFFAASDESDKYYSDNDKVVIVPIHRLRGKNASAMNYFDSFITWIKLKLLPEGLKPAHEKTFKGLLDDYEKIEEYLTIGNGTITFNSAKFSADVLAGTFTEKVFGYDFDIRGTLSAVMSGQKKFSGKVSALKQELLECDHKRANIQPYDERQLTDVNRGHWELFEAAADSSEEVTVNLPATEFFIARPPQLDVRLNATCAIDFGTKSTIVVCRDGEARMLRIGKGDYSKAPTMQDFENPTVISLKDVEGFLAAYRKREGRPFTEWNQLTVSHQAAETLRAENLTDSTIFNSVFSELKQWAKSENEYPFLVDAKKHSQEVKPYLETNPIDDGGFDPIEIYAYYLGLYINNMHHQIYLDYILSFPVNYKKDVREKIRASFERGIKKSLPPALIADEEIMKRFRVYLGASEPAAYAITALEANDLQPREIGQKVAYGVFDFGGGTTDFDFGIEYIPEKAGRNFVIEQFGYNGDVLLGGENILELLAYEVYKANLGEMRENEIPFALPLGCEIFAGAETLVSRTKDAAAHMNSRILAEKLRPLWENNNAEKLNADAQSVTLFSNKKGAGKIAVQLNIKIEDLQKCIEERIRQGVENFFQSLYKAFSGKEIYPIHIFLAGNSCKSPVVKKIFEEFIAREEERMKRDIKDYDEIFILHMPLAADTENPAEMDLDRQRTGKTGVAFGLLRCRRGGKDVKIINRNVDSGGEMIFPYFLGDAGITGDVFTIRIDKNVDYGAWKYFTVADEPEFELYYTAAPRALNGNLPVNQVSMIRCLLDGFAACSTTTKLATTKRLACTFARWRRTRLFTRSGVKTILLENSAARFTRRFYEPKNSFSTAMQSAW